MMEFLIGFLLLLLYFVAVNFVLDLGNSIPFGLGYFLLLVPALLFSTYCSNLQEPNGSYFIFIKKYDIIYYKDKK